MRLFDTARRAVVDFAPGPVVSLYTCGITPYDATHLGHAAAFVTYDVLQRRLRDRGHETHCVRNITDVDDDILRAARKRDMHYLDLGTAEIRRFDDDMAAQLARRTGMGVALGTRSPRVAHRMFGARTAGARMDDRSPRWWRRLDLSPSRMRTRAVRMRDG